MGEAVPVLSQRTQTQTHQAWKVYQVVAGRSKEHELVLVATTFVYEGVSSHLGSWKCRQRVVVVGGHGQSMSSGRGI